MRIAVCLSGQIRPSTFKKSYESIYNSIIKHHNPDIFVHSWLDDAEDGKDLVIQTYNPKKYIIDSYSPNTPSETNYNFRSMFKSIYESNRLKIEYELENNFKYDIVIRCRFDIVIDEIRDFSVYSKDMLIAKSGTLDGLPVINDIFAFGSSETMDVYSDVINHLETIIEKLKSKQRTLCAETIISQHLTNHNIQTSMLPVWFGLARHVKC
jgi:hypothetical protein